MFSNILIVLVFNNLLDDLNTISIFYTKNPLVSGGVFRKGVVGGGVVGGGGVVWMVNYRLYNIFQV